MERGQDYGLALAGYFANRSLRVEKFYAFWGQDLGTTTTPLECGRGFRVKFNVSADTDRLGMGEEGHQGGGGSRAALIFLTGSREDKVRCEGSPALASESVIPQLP